MAQEIGFLGEIYCDMSRESGFFVAWAWLLGCLAACVTTVSQLVNYFFVVPAWGC